MVARYDLPRVKSTTQPSFFNHETAKWAFIGDLVGTALAVAVGGLAILSGSGIGAVVGLILMPAISLGGLALGAQYGAKTGQAQQTRELAEGKVVHDPVYWNKGILSGLVVGRVATLALSLLGLNPFGLGLIGAIAGSILHKHTLQRDFDQAVALKEQAVSAQPMISRERSRSPYRDSVTPEETLALEEKQTIRPTGSHTQTVLANAERDPAEAQR